MSFNKFHKWQFDDDDVSEMCKNSKLKITNIFYVRNVSFLFKWDFFRHKSLKKKNFVESKARSGGFKLNLLGRILDSFLHKKFPKIFSNVIVVWAEKI